MIHGELWRSLAAKEPTEVVRNSLARYDETTRGYSLNILHHDFSIFPQEKIIQARQGPDYDFLGYHGQLSAVNYLIGAKNMPQTGDWIGEKEFPTGPIFFRGNHAMPTERLEQAFGKEAAIFSLACGACGGTRVEEEDLAYEMPVFPRVPVRIILWLADEEFPARVAYLFERTANLHLKLDALWSVGKLIESALLKTLAETPQSFYPR